MMRRLLSATIVLLVLNLTPATAVVVAVCLTTVVDAQYFDFPTDNIFWESDSVWGLCEQGKSSTNGHRVIYGNVFDGWPQDEIALGLLWSPEMSWPMEQQTDWLVMDSLLGVLDLSNVLLMEDPFFQGDDTSDIFKNNPLSGGGHNAPKRNRHSFDSLEFRQIQLPIDSIPEPCTFMLMLGGVFLERILRGRKKVHM